MKKKIIFALAIILFVVLTQIILVKLVYAHKLNDSFSNTLSIIYNLKAGEIKNKDGGFKVYLKDYFEHKSFIEKFIDKQLEADLEGQESLINKNLTAEEIDELVWYKIVKDAWLDKNAKANDISVSEDDVKQYIESIGGENALKADVDKYDLSYKQYRKLVIEYYVLEAKVYQYFLANYIDLVGAKKAQELYSMLESENGANFDEVAKNYADDIRYAETSIFLKSEELIDYYEPIRDLEVGAFSKIVKVPDGYIIWKLDSVSGEGSDKAWEVRGIFIAAQTIDEFLDNYLAESEVKRVY